MKVERWFWSDVSDGPNFHGPFPTREAAIAEAECELDPTSDIYVGQSRQHEVEVDADDVLEHVVCQLDDLYEDAADDWCRGVSKERRDALSRDLTEVLKRHLSDWDERAIFDVITDPEHFREAGGAA